MKIYDENNAERFIGKKGYFAYSLNPLENLENLKNSLENFENLPEEKRVYFGKLDSIEKEFMFSLIADIDGKKIGFAYFIPV
jgi:hypothetical protein